LISISVQRLTCPRQHPYGPAKGLVSGQLSPAAGGGASHDAAGFLPPFGYRHSLLGHPVPAGEFRSPHGRPTRTWPGPRQGSHVPHIRVTAGLGALFTPRPSGAVTAGPIPPAAARPLCQGPGPITPACLPSPGTVYYEASSRVHSRSPARPSPSPVIPGWNGDFLGLHPGLRTPQARPAAHAWAGDGHRALARSYTTGITGPPIHELTRNVRPRVARSGWT